MTEEEKRSRKAAGYGEYRDEGPDRFEETYPDGSLKNECWRSSKKGRGLPKRDTDRPVRGPED